MAFNEDSRVKIPALIHFTRLGYDYIPQRNRGIENSFDNETNIELGTFEKQLKKMNPDVTDEQISAEIKNIKEELGYDDLGRAFYKRLQGIGEGSLKLVDWNNFNNNTFHVTTELTNANGDEEFRPDITILINGLPLSFIEVKKPNNKEGIKAEYDRINWRFKNEKFRKFINITQLLFFSNNMEYEDSDLQKLQGAFYATTAKGYDTKFNHFREQRKSDYIDSIKEIDEEVEDFILKDNNAQIIKHSPEFITNKDIDTPTNRIISSLYEKERLRYLLKHAICYVDEFNEATGENQIQKHIMRYPQFFATKAITARLDENEKKGVIWHTQGSGKTALSFYATGILKEYYAKKGIIPKFYFIVDRLDLANQAKDEFAKRGLKVNTISSKQELINDFKNNTSTEGITVLNIHKFREDTTSFDDSGYDINVQRVFFIDEAHRSYNPKGSFLANLYNSDKNSIKIALTGTPLIIYGDHDEKGNIKDATKKEEAKTTRNIFGDYIHKYYYNDSIRDGYTLKLLREEIETTYKEQAKQLLNNIKVQMGDINKKDLFSHPKYAKEMLSYIVKDFKESRIRFGDKTIGAMVVCDSAEQAREMFKQFNETKDEHGLSSALILHNEDDKEIRKKHTKSFKDGNTDILFVYSMLLTGFDAPRLKKLYLGRKVRAHNLLQTLTRVNRPYKNFPLGYVVDFADISAEFEITNQAYFRELNQEYSENLDGEDPDNIFGSLFMNKNEIDQRINDAKMVISDYNTDNLEIFTQQITDITDRKTLSDLQKSLQSAREVYNVARLLGYTEVLEKLDFKLIAQLIRLVADRLKLLNSLSAKDDISSEQLLNIAMEDAVFNFNKIGEEELRLLSEDLHSMAAKVRHELALNINQKDPEWLSLKEAFLALLEKHHIDPDSESLENMKFESAELKKIFADIKELNRKYNMLCQKFGGDQKFAVIYKNYQPTGYVSDNTPLYKILNDIKAKIDDRVLYNENVLQNTGYFRRDVGTDVVESYESSSYEINPQLVRKLQENIADEYISEYRGE